MKIKIYSQDDLPLKIPLNIYNVVILIESPYKQYHCF